MIPSHFRDEIINYQSWRIPIPGIIQAHGHKLLAINGMSDHLHIFFGMRPTQSLSDLMQDIKGSSSKWINEKRFINDRFEWQEGYGAFSYSKSQTADVIAYIQNQEMHHHKLSFLDEYKKFLEKFEVDFDERYIFKAPE